MSSDWYLHLSQYATRRKAFHHVIDDEGTTRWVGMDAADAFAFIAEHGPDEFMLRTRAGVHRVRWLDHNYPW